MESDDPLEIIRGQWMNEQCEDRSEALEHALRSLWNHMPQMCPLHLYHLRSAHAAHGGGALFLRLQLRGGRAKKQSAPAMGGMG